MYSDGCSPYQEIHDSLGGMIWPERDPVVRLTSPKKLCDNLLFGDTSAIGLLVVTDGDTAQFSNLLNLKERIPHLVVKYESELNSQDRNHNITYFGQLADLTFSAFRAAETPIRITEDSLFIGSIAFAKDEVGIQAFMPNPYAPGRFVELSFRKAGYNNHADYWIHRRGEDGSAATLLEGRFAKDGDNWEFSPDLAFGPALPAAMCEGETCPAPPTKANSTSLVEKLQRQLKSETFGEIQIWTMGTLPSRFPDIHCTRGTAWITWETSGNICAARIPTDQDPQFYVVEADSGDAYDPRIADDGQCVWVIFLYKSGGFYQLHGRYTAGPVFSQPVLLSQPGPYNCVTPAATGDRARTLTVFWSEHKANQRTLQSRTIEQRVLQKIQSVKLTDSGLKGGYSNAWYPSLCAGRDGPVWASWNQHYPTTLGVHAAAYGDSGKMVSETGGYSSMCVTLAGIPWITWRSGAMTENYGFEQTVYAAHYDRETETWSLPQTVSDLGNTSLNDTPDIDADGDGDIWLCWSGRKNQESPWGVYLSVYRGDKWSEQELLSDPAQHARAPRLAVQEDGGVWVTWHEGTGDGMRIKLWHRSATARMAGR